MDDIGQYMKQVADHARQVIGEQFRAELERLDWPKMLAESCHELKNKIELLEAEVKFLKNALEVVTAQRNEASCQVNALIHSCCYRNANGKVEWRQGNYFGTSTADDTDPESYEQAMEAICRNAGISELFLDDYELDEDG